MPPQPFDETLIIADDDHSLRGIMRSSLARPRRALFFAANGIEAVQFAESMQADVVLLDMRMPRLGGLDACRKIRALPHYASVPIAILTAYDTDIDRKRARQAGVTAFYTKPVSVDRLARNLDTLLASRRETGALPA
jgi:CheY-like chemotaxis protein